MTRLTGYISAVFLFLVLALTFGATGGSVHEDELSSSFNKDMWVDEQKIYQDPNPRIQMVDDVLKNHLTKGMTREEITSLLGQPTDTPYFKDRDMVYWLGQKSGGLSVDSHWLVIDLDADGKAQIIERVTD